MTQVILTFDRFSLKRLEIWNLNNALFPDFADQL